MKMTGNVWRPGRRQLKAEINNETGEGRRAKTIPEDDRRD